MQLQLQSNAGADIASNSFAASDTVKLLATLKTAAGAPAANEVVTFAEAGGSLLQFTPSAATALTNASGQAMIEVNAKALDSLGATTVSATATLGGTAYSASRNFAVSAGVTEVIDPQTLATSIGFVSAVPADRSIVIAGSGGVGRTETAILQFQVLNSQNVGVPSVRVEFTAPADVLTLASATGYTDANGFVSATVSSKRIAQTVEVTAKVPGASQPLSTPSGLVTVTNGLPAVGALDLSASQYLLNNDLSGDSSTISVRLVDANGNRVSDGFAVVAGVDYGGIGTSGRGGCTLVEGQCSVDYTVQNPRSPTGLINILVSGHRGDGEAFSGNIRLYASSVDNTSLFDAGSTTPKTDFSGLAFDRTNCKAVWMGDLGTAIGMGAPAGTTISVESFSGVVSAAVSNGSPSPDSRNGSRTFASVTFTLTGATAPGQANLLFTLNADSLIRQYAATLSYPACTPAT
ncbi:Ig-like domain-containing protein [Comamonas endophytica]